MSLKKISIYFLALIIIVVPFVLLFSPIIFNYNKTAKNTHVIGKDYSSLSREDIYQKVNSDFVLPQTLTLKTPQKDYNFNLATVSAQIDSQKLASTILYRRLNQGIWAYIKYFFSNKNFPLEISYNAEAFDKYLADLSSQINHPFIPSEFQLKESTLNYIPGQLGLEMSSDELKQRIINSLSTGDFSSPIVIPHKSSGYLPTDSEISQTKSRAEKLIGKNLVLTTENTSIPIDNKTLISWLDFRDDYNQNDLEEFSKSTSASLKRDPVNAVFKFENDKVLEFRPAANGIVPQEKELSDLIKTSIDKLISSEEKQLTAVVPVKTVEPDVRTQDANNLGIKDLLGKGVSTFNHSTAIRNFNVEKGASIVNRILIAPGETFSFIKSLGEVSLDNGYKKAYIIRQGKTELDVGGGICQVSTTLFRAMLNSGLDITDRKAHAYRVSYYEEDMLPGYDATVFIPNPDLKFVNDTGHYVLIQSNYEDQNKKLTYEIYGTSDGRKVDISNYRQWDAQPAPPDKYIDDPTLPPGKVVQDEHRVPGLKTAFDWKVISFDGKILHQKTFQSVYVPWAAVYRRGI
ncbi:MAG: VanW family protein [Candidatus Shapirobacteria bacterium]|nr:VanW family protein [Candidatus Shapirobacteria bacterium]